MAANANPKPSAGSDSLLSRFNSWVLMLGTAGTLVLPSGYSLAPVFLLLFSLALLWQRPRLNLSRDDKILLWLLIGYFALNLAYGLIADVPGRAYSGYSRFLLAAPVLLLLLAHPPKPGFWWLGVALAALAAGLWALWHRWALGHSRVGEAMNPIQFGAISVIMSSLCAAGLAWARLQPRPRLWTGLMVSGFFAGLVASLLSGARGGWLVVPFIVGLCFWQYRGDFLKHHFSAALALTLLAMALAYLLPQTGVKHRLNLAMEELTSYRDHGQSESSVGVRLAMWRAGLELALEKPLVGWGDEAFLRPLQERVAHPRTRRMIGSFDHLHNELLDAQVKRGLVGSLGLLALYFVPLALFGRRLKQGRPELRSYALAGVLLVIGASVVGLTQSFFSHNSGVTFYAFSLVIIWGLLRREERRQEVQT